MYEIMGRIIRVPIIEYALCHKWCPSRWMSLGVRCKTTTNKQRPATQGMLPPPHTHTHSHTHTHTYTLAPDALHHGTSRITPGYYPRPALRLSAGPGVIASDGVDRAQCILERFGNTGRGRHHRWAGDKCVAMSTSKQPAL